MLYVAIAEAVALACVVIVLGNLLRITIRQGARERELLVNQVCALAGKPWRIPPASVPSPEVEPEEDYALAVPEQMPDY